MNKIKNRIILGKRPYYTIIAIIVLWSFLFTNITWAYEQVRISQLRPLASGERRILNYEILGLNRTKEGLKGVILKFMGRVGLLQELSDMGHDVETIARELAYTDTDYGASRVFTVEPYLVQQGEEINTDLESLIAEKIQKGDRTFIVYPIGLGNFPMELEQFLRMFHRMLLKKGEDPRNWTVNIYEIDATRGIIENAQLQFLPIRIAYLKTHDPKEVPLAGLNIKPHFIHANILDAEGIQETLEQLSAPKADYILFRYVFYITETIEGRKDMLKGESEQGSLPILLQGDLTSDFVLMRVALQIYMAWRNILPLAKEEGTRLIIEPSQYLGIESPENIKVFHPPGCSVLGKRGAGILMVEDPTIAEEIGLQKFVEFVREHTGVGRQVQVDPVSPLHLKEAIPRPQGFAGTSILRPLATWERRSEGPDINLAQLRPLAAEERQRYILGKDPVSIRYKGPFTIVLSVDKNDPPEEMEVRGDVRLQIMHYRDIPNCFLLKERIDRLIKSGSGSVTADDYFIVDIDNIAYSRMFKTLRDGEKVLIGRQDPHRFNLPGTISKSHVEITREGDRIIIKDLGSRNGTSKPMFNKEMSEEMAKIAKGNAEKIDKYVRIARDPQVIAGIMDKEGRIRAFGDQEEAQNWGKELRKGKVFAFGAARVVAGDGSAVHYKLLTITELRGHKFPLAVLQTLAASLDEASRIAFVPQEVSPDRDRAIAAVVIGQLHEIMASGVTADNAEQAAALISELSWQIPALGDIVISIRHIFENADNGEITKEKALQDVAGLLSRNTQFIRRLLMMAEGDIPSVENDIGKTVVDFTGYGRGAKESLRNILRPLAMGEGRVFGKTTKMQSHRSRLRGTHPGIISFLNGQSTSVLDVGIGFPFDTVLELKDSISEVYPHVKVTAMDINLPAIVVQTSVILPGLHSNANLIFDKKRELIAVNAIPLSYTGKGLRENLDMAATYQACMAIKEQLSKRLQNVGGTSFSDELGNKIIINPASQPENQRTGLYYVAGDILDPSISIPKGSVDVIRDFNMAALYYAAPGEKRAVLEAEGKLLKKGGHIVMGFTAILRKTEEFMVYQKKEEGETPVPVAFVFSIDPELIGVEHPGAESGVSDSYFKDDQRLYEDYMRVVIGLIPEDWQGDKLDYFKDMQDADPGYRATFLQNIVAGLNHRGYAASLDAGGSIILNYQADGLRRQIPSAQERITKHIGEAIDSGI